jgi:hypothetical protein
MADNEKEEKEPQDVELITWYKKIEIIGIDIKSLHKENETRRLKLRTTFMNQHFINELDKNWFTAQKDNCNYLSTCSTFWTQNHNLVEC